LNFLLLLLLLRESAWACTCWHSRPVAVLVVKDPGGRPFYTMPCPDDPNYTNSFDIFIRGMAAHFDRSVPVYPYTLAASSSSLVWPLVP